MTPEKRADIAERYGWQEGEREALQRDMAERERRIAARGCGGVGQGPECGTGRGRAARRPLSSRDQAKQPEPRMTRHRADLGNVGESPHQGEP